MDRINTRINELLENGPLRADDEKFNFFKKKILPSVLYEWITPKGYESCSYRCPFDSCAALVSKGHILERHLREQHFDELPHGVFGLNRFECFCCGIQFKRLEHLNKHKEGRTHLKMSISKGTASDEECERWESIRNGEHEHFELAKCSGLTCIIIDESSNEESKESSFLSLNLSNFSSQSKEISLLSLSAHGLIDTSQSILTSTPFINELNAEKHSNDSLEDLLLRDSSFIEILNELESKSSPVILIENEESEGIVGKRKFDDMEYGTISSPKLCRLNDSNDIARKRKRIN